MIQWALYAGQVMNSLQVKLISIFNDNYVFVITDLNSKKCVVVDPGESDSVETFLNQHQLKLEAIILTHHHDDHIGGALELKTNWKVPVFAPKKNQSQIPFATDYVIEGQLISLLDKHLNLNVIELPGHTLGHVAYYDKNQHWLFSGDVLFGLGCGRLFEGTFEQGFESLQRIKQLPDETLVYCTHEYTEANLQFCKKLSNAVDLSNYEKSLMQLRQNNLPSVPLNLGIEKKVNPFLIAESAEDFTQVRKLRNQG